MTQSIDLRVSDELAIPVMPEFEVTVLVGSVDE